MALTPVVISTSPRALPINTGATGRPALICTQATGGHATPVVVSTSPRAIPAVMVGGTNFPAGGPLPTGSTFARASTATYFDSTKTLQSAATNTPRYTYDPSTGAYQGLLVEPAATNRVRNNTATGAAAGSPGTPPTNWSLTPHTTSLAQTIIGTGTESGLNYLDVEYHGSVTTTGTEGMVFELTAAAAAVTGQAWTHSVYARLVAGAFPAGTTMTGRIGEYDSTQTLLTNHDIAFTLPTGNPLAAQRQSTTVVLNQATTAYVSGAIYFTIPTGSGVDFTVRVGMPQTEQQPAASSVIPTVNAGAVTRAADVLTVPFTNGIYNMAVKRLSGTVTYLNETVTGGAWTVPASASPLQSINATAVTYTNLITSQDLTTAFWSYTNVTAPDATDVRNTTVSGNHYVASTNNLTITAGQKLAFSADLTRAGALQWVNGFANGPGVTGNVGCTFDLINGTFSSGSAAADWSGFSASIVNKGGGNTYRCTMTWTTSAITTAVKPFFNLLGAAQAFSYAGVVTDGVTISNMYLGGSS